MPKEQLGPRIWLRLTGEAKTAVERLDVDTDIAVEAGVDNLLKCVDNEFMQEEYDKIDEVVIVFWNLRGESGQTMEAYIMAMQTSKAKMEKEDPETKIGEKAYAVRMLKRAGLSREEKPQVIICERSSMRQNSNRKSTAQAVQRCRVSESSLEEVRATAEWLS